MTDTKELEWDQSLLAPHEPPPYEVVNENGKAPMMIACDHASNRIPLKLGGLGIDPALLDLHIAYDIGAWQVARRLSEKFDAPLLVANYSRLAVDLNRHYGDPGMFPEVSDHHPIPGNKDLDAASRQLRIQSLFEPYHRQHGEMVDERKRRFVKPIILSVHSFTDCYQGFARPWHFGVLWDQDEELAKRLLANFTTIAQDHDPILVVGDNEPYHARNPLGYSLVAHAASKNVEMALIEIRQDLIADEAGQRWAAEILYQIVEPLLDQSII